MNDYDKTTVIAKVCHEVNRIYCESIGDTSQLPWSEAPEWQKHSAINGVEFFFHNKRVSLADMHDNWAREKYATGWKYGPTKDAEKKEHPCLVPYDELPKQQQLKDKFRAGVSRRRPDKYFFNTKEKHMAKKQEEQEEVQAQENPAAGSDSPPAKKVQKPTIARIMHYQIDDPEAAPVAALVVEIDEHGLPTLALFDPATNGIRYKRAVPLADKPTPNHANWPPRV